MDKTEKLFGRYFVIYHRPHFRKNQFMGFVKRCEYIFDLTHSKGRKVIDVGCGFGLISVIFYLVGADEVRGIDISKGKIDKSFNLLSYLGLDSQPVFPIGWRLFEFRMALLIFRYNHLP